MLFCLPHDAADDPFAARVEFFQLRRELFRFVPVFGREQPERELGSPCAMRRSRAVRWRTRYRLR